MTSGQQDEAFFRERGFGLKIGFGARPALIIIDMIKAFTDPAMMLGANLDQQIAATQPLLAAARERKIPTIFSTVMYNEADLADAGIWTLKQKGVVTLKAGTDKVEVDPRLDFGHRDILLVKKYFRDGPRVQARQPAGGHVDHHGLHDQRLRTGDRRRRAAERAPPHGGAGSGR